MMILFQNKIIYMPSVPPFSRQEKIADYAPKLKPVQWAEHTIKSLDGTPLTLCVGSLPSDSTNEAEPGSSFRHVYVVYFQGNGSSLPPRLPKLSEALRSMTHVEPPIQCTIVALSYRGYWTSSGSASQPGIEKDAAAAIDWTLKLKQNSKERTQLVLWGQSIGAGVATQAAANFLRKPTSDRERGSIDGIVLETPFVSLREMLVSLYPQKWLPYRYLWPFLRNWWDSEAALRDIKQLKGPRDVLILTAGKDEVVPPEHGHRLAQLATDLGLVPRRVNIPGALHHEVMSRREGRAAISEFIKRLD